MSEALRAEPSLALALVEAIAADPEARARLRELIGPIAAAPSEPLGFTVARLSTKTGLSPKSVRGAIQRGDLRATRRGEGPRAPFLISAEDAREWLRGKRAGAKARRPEPQQARGQDGKRPLAGALATLLKEGAAV